MEADERHRVVDRGAPPWEFRGRDLSRILALSDGIFAFAMTLLVLNLTVPVVARGVEVRDYLSSGPFVAGLYAYTISILVIFQWWQGHQQVFRFIAGYSRQLLRANVAFLAFIAIMPFGTTVLNAAGGDFSGPIVFSLLQVGAGSSLAIVWLYAKGSSGLIHDRLPESWQRYISLAMIIPPIYFAATIPIALISPQAAEICWLGIFAVPFVSRRLALRLDPDSER